MNRRSQPIPPAKRSLTAILSAVAILFAVALSLYHAPSHFAESSVGAPAADNPAVRQDVSQGCCGSSEGRSEEHTSELQSRQYLVCRLLLEKKNIKHRHCRQFEM